MGLDPPNCICRAGVIIPYGLTHPRKSILHHMLPFPTRSSTPSMIIVQSLIVVVVGGIIISRSRLRHGYGALTESQSRGARSAEGKSASGSVSESVSKM
jgi:hypothetical protein